jgi:hypothetical protein
MMGSKKWVKRTMPNEENTMEWVRRYLPPQAELLSAETGHRPFVRMSDFDGDGTKELAAAYRLHGENYVVILKKRRDSWQVAANIKGRGYAVSDWLAAPFTSRRRNQLMVGWQAGAIWSSLSIYEWTPRGWKDVAPPDL